MWPQPKRGTRGAAFATRSDESSCIAECQRLAWWCWRKLYLTSTISSRGWRDAEVRLRTAELYFVSWKMRLQKTNCKFCPWSDSGLVWCRTASIDRIDRLDKWKVASEARNTLCLDPRKSMIHRRSQPGQELTRDGHVWDYPNEERQHLSNPRNSNLQSVRKKNNRIKDSLL